MSKLLDGSPTSKLVRLILLLYAAGDVDKLSAWWHPDMEVISRAGDTITGRDDIYELTSALLERDRIELDPHSVRIAGTDALIDGCIVFSETGEQIPATWLWSFRDGKLWRSVTFERADVPVVSPERARPAG